MACELLESSQSMVHILYVIEVERRFPLDAEVDTAAAAGEAVLRDMESVARNYKCRTDAELLQARKAGVAVVQEAMDRGVDAIMVGTPFKRQFGSYSLGDSIPYILKNAPCRVIVSREPAESETTRRG